MSSKLQSTSVELPWKNLEDVTFINGEDITYTTLNEKIIRLLDNDLAIYKNKVANSKLAVMSYDNMLTKYCEDNDTDITANYKVTNDMAIWLNDDCSSVSSNLINIVYPIIPIPNPSSLAYPKPSYCNYASIENELSNYLDSELNFLLVTSYNIVLQNIQDFILRDDILEKLGVKPDGTGNNVLRYDLLYFASFNQSINYQLYYNKGFRWAEAIITKESLSNIYRFAKNVKLPYFSVKAIDNNVSASTDGYDLVNLYSIEQHIINNNTQGLLGSFSDGGWCKSFGSGWIEQGGIIQVVPNTDTKTTYDFINKKYKFNVPFSTCLNVQLSIYNNTKPDNIIKNESSTLTVCPVRVKSYDSTGFTITAQPDYLVDNIVLSSSKTLSEFNILWRATGIR